MDLCGGAESRALFKANRAVISQMTLMKQLHG
jgi:hypothetical protein